MAIALDHIILSVADMRSSVAFYYETLRFKSEPIALVRVSPTTVLQLIQRPPQASQHLAFSMDRAAFDETLARLKSGGVGFGDSFDSVGTSSGPGTAHGSQKNGDSIYFKDPDQHMLEIICYQAAT